MKCTTLHLFCMLVGDLVSHDEVWEFIIIFKKIMHLILKTIQKECASLLEFFVAEHHKIFKTIQRSTET